MGWPLNAMHATSTVFRRRCPPSHHRVECGGQYLRHLGSRPRYASVIISGRPTVSVPLSSDIICGRSTFPSSAHNGLFIQPQIPPMVTEPRQPLSVVQRKSGSGWYPKMMRYAADGKVSELLSKAQKTLHFFGERAVRAARAIRWDVSQQGLDRPIFV